MTAPGRDSHIPRKAFHAIAGSILPTAYYLKLAPDVWVVTAMTLITCVWICFDAARFRSPRLNKFFNRRFGFLMKRKEAKSFTGVTYMLAGATLTLILFKPPVAVTVLYFIALGDPAAAVVGRAFGRVKIFNGRTLEGSVTMFAVCLAIGLVFADVPPSAAVAGAFVASLAELYSGPVDDNLMVPVLSGAAIMSLG